MKLWIFYTLIVAKIVDVEQGFTFEWKNNTQSDLKISSLKNCPESWAAYLDKPSGTMVSFWDKVIDGVSLDGGRTFKNVWTRAIFDDKQVRNAVSGGRCVIRFSDGSERDASSSDEDDGIPDWFWGRTMSDPVESKKSGLTTTESPKRSLSAI